MYILTAVSSIGNAFAPYSQLFPTTHTKFSKSFQLKFEGEPLTDIQVERFYKSARAELNKVVAQWKRSGNGAENTVKRNRHLQYTTETASDDEIVDDDCQHFFNLCT